MRSTIRLSALSLCLAIVTGTGCYGLGKDIFAKLGTFTVTPLSGLATAEAAGNDTFSVVLNRAPSGDVTVALSSSDSGEAVPGVPSLTFTTLNWNVPQIVTVTGVDDPDDDGPIPFTIVLAAAVSADYHYSGIKPDDVTGSNDDDDTAGVTVTPTAGLSTDENGGTATFDVVLDSRPTADVTIALASSNTSEGTVLPVSMTFTAANWNLPQEATVTGVNDTAVPVVEPSPTGYTINTGPVTSADTLYNGIGAADVSVVNVDNDSPGISVTPASGLTTSETDGALGTATFSVVLTTSPVGGDVVIDVASSNDLEGLVSTGAGTPASSLQLTFDAGNWNTPQIVILTGVNDPEPVVDGDQAYTIQVTVNAASTTDNTYDAVVAADPAVTNVDDDDAGFILSPEGLELDTVEQGLAVPFTVRLASIPSSSVTITVLSMDTTEGTVSTGTLTFQPDATALDPQSVDVTPVDDNDLDGPVTYVIQLSADTTLDPNYLALDPADVTVTNADNDVPGLTVTPPTVSTSESLTSANISIKLESIPTSTVTVTVTGLDATEGSLSSAVFTFDPDATALQVQTLVVTGVDDVLGDLAVIYTLTFTPTSADLTYNSLAAATVDVTNNDNDTNPPGSAPGPGVEVLGPTPVAYDDKRLLEPSVLQSGATFTMWYEGSNAAGQKHEQVGLAAGSDPLTWVKDPAAPVLTHTGGTGDVDKSGVGDPCVVLVAPGDYRMWFGCRQNPGLKTHIGYATSSDGVVWTKYQIGGLTEAVLAGTPGAFDQKGVSSPHVILDGATWRMWFQGFDGSGIPRIGHATSSDGIVWTKLGGATPVPVLDLGGPGAFDSSAAAQPCVMKDAATYRMWYIGAGSGGVQRMGYAQSGDGVTWTKFPGNPILDVGAPGSFSERNVWSPWVVKDGSLYRIWFAGEDNTGLIRLAYTQSN